MSRLPLIRLRAPTPSEWPLLRQVTRAQAARFAVVRRARVLLAVAQGPSSTAAAQFAGYHRPSTVTALVRRFNARGGAVLAVAPGHGPPPTYDAPARRTILTTLQQPPDRAQDGTATWSLSALQHRLRRTDPSLRRVGRTTLWRVLHTAGYSDQHSRTWCSTGQVQRRGPQGLRTVVDPRPRRPSRLVGYPRWWPATGSPIRTI